MLNAKGGVYNSPSLSAYSGQIVSKPTMFAFSSGAGIMGEAGPEAIIPLARGSDGKLGVALVTTPDKTQPTHTRNYGGSTTINIAVQPTSSRRTADQIAQEVSRKQRLAQARNA